MLFLERKKYLRALVVNVNCITQLSSVKAFLPLMLTTLQELSLSLVEKHSSDNYQLPIGHGYWLS